MLNQSNGSLHLDGIIGVTGEDNQLLTGNSGTISRVEKDEDIQDLKSNSGQLDSIKFRDILIVRLPDCSVHKVSLLMESSSDRECINF